jgi:hypothetical protein
MNEWNECKQLTYCMRMRRQDLEGGRGIMEQLTQVGNPEAQMGMGFLYATGQETHSCCSPVFFQGTYMEPKLKNKIKDV